MASTTAATRQKEATWKARFIESLRESANVRLAAHAAGIDRTTAYRHRQSDEQFALGWHDALDEAIDKLEAEAWRRGVDGYDKPVFQGGSQVGVIREYSDTLLIFMLKGHRPERFRERYELTGKNGGPIQLADAERMLDESLAGD